MTASDTPPPLTDEELQAIRELWADIRTSRTEKTAIGDMVPVDIDLFDAKLPKVFAEVDRLKAALATVSDEAGVQCREAAARTVRAEKERDDLKRQIDWLAEWLTQHTDEPKGSYGAVEAAINAMAGFQRHINRSAEVWAENRAELEKLRAENAALAAKLDAVHDLVEEAVARMEPVSWVDALRAALGEASVPVCFAAYGQSSTLCGETLPRRVDWDFGKGDYSSPALTTRRNETTCPKCRAALGETGGTER